MKEIFRARLRLPALFLAALAACDGDDGSRAWRDLGEVPAPASTRLNHTPMIVANGAVIIGTNDGLWQRPLSSAGDWEPTGLAGLRVFAVRTHPTDATVLFAAGQPLDDPQAAPFYRSNDRGATWTASSSWPRNPFDNSTETFFDLAVAPDDPDRLYANLSGPSIGISTDGGLNWTLANGATEVFFGDPCLLHILPTQTATLYQGCEAPLDNAWIATYDIDPDDPFNLANFTFVAGGPDFALGNRRPNSLASGPARPDTLYAGLEGALIALRGTAFDWVLEVDEEGGSDLPYAYIKGIWLDPNDDEHVVFGGGVNGMNAVLALFATRDHGASIRRLDAPRVLSDPSVEQIVPAPEGDRLAVLVSEADGVEDEERSLRVLLLNLGAIAFE